MAVKFKPYRASDMDWSKAKFPLMAFPKIDGVRGVNVAGAITGRTLLPFANEYTSARFSKDEYSGFDGELTLGTNLVAPGLCRDTSSAVNTILGEPDVHWNLFDVCALSVQKHPYIERYNMLRDHINACHQLGQLLNVSVVPYVMVHNIEEAQAIHKHYVAGGYEGTIYRNPNEIYKHGTSTPRECGYMREKDFVQEDARVIAIKEGQTNLNTQKKDAFGNAKRSTHKENMIPNGKVGSLICTDIKTGEEIVVGSGCMTDAQCGYYFEHQDEIIGKIISYKHMPYGAKDKKRFPTFVNIRGDNDVLPPENPVV